MPAEGWRLKAKSCGAVFPGMLTLFDSWAIASPVAICHYLPLQLPVWGWVSMDLCKPSCLRAVQWSPRAPCGSCGSFWSSSVMGVGGSIPGPWTRWSGHTLWHVIRIKTDSKGLHKPGQPWCSQPQWNLWTLCLRRCQIGLGLCLTWDMLVKTWASW